MGKPWEHDGLMGFVGSVIGFFKYFMGFLRDLMGFMRYFMGFYGILRQSSINISGELDQYVGLLAY